MPERGIDATSHYNLERTCKTSSLVVVAEFRDDFGNSAVRVSEVPFYRRSIHLQINIKLVFSKVSNNPLKIPNNLRNYRNPIGKPVHSDTPKC